SDGGAGVGAFDQEEGRDIDYSRASPAPVRILARPGNDGRIGAFSGAPAHPLRAFAGPRLYYNFALRLRTLADLLRPSSGARHHYSAASLRTTTLPSARASAPARATAGSPLLNGHNELV